MTLAITLLHPAVSALAFFQSTQLSLFEQFLTNAVSGIDSTSITSGMQTVAYIVLLVGFLWQVYQSALHGGDVRGLGTNLIKYIVTATIIMNYHAVFTTINQGFVNAGNWINSASGAQNLFDNWQSDLQTQYNQVGFQQMWGLVTGSLAGLIDALLILVAYFLYPIVIVIFGFFYIFYGSVLYIFGPIVIALMPLSATNRLAKSYVENIFIWNAWPILYGGFGALLSAVQMGQVGQMLNTNNFLGGLGNVEGSVLIGIASIIYSLAIAVIPFIAKRIVSGDVGSTAAALMGAAATALTAGIAGVEGVGAGIAATRATGTTAGLSSGQSAGSTGFTGSTVRTQMGAAGNQPAPQQRSSGSPSTGSATGSGHTEQSRSTTTTSSGDTSAEAGPRSIGEQDAARIRAAMGGGPGGSVSPQASAPQGSSSTRNGSSVRATGSGTPGRQGQGSRGDGSQRPSMRPYSLATWGAYHTARLATAGAMKGGQSAIYAISHPTDTAARIGGAAGSTAGSIVNAADSVARAVSHPVTTAQEGARGVRDSIVSGAGRVAATTKESADQARSSFSSAYETKREENR
jgi:hypothetical protein